MKIWLDSINSDVIAEAAKAGIVSGVTTNPSILSETQNVGETLRCLLDIQPGPVAVQVTAQNAADIIDEARSIYEFSDRMIVKIPINYHGLIAIEELKNDRIPILGTGILYATQALLAANQAIAYVAPYFSRMGDSGYETLKTIVDMLSKTPTKVLAASVKSLDQFIYCARIGVDAVTIKLALYHQLVEDHPAVESFLHRFREDWVQAHGDASINDLLKTGLKKARDKSSAAVFAMEHEVKHHHA